MTVQELIKKLLEFDPELEVMYEDNEEGERDIEVIKIEERQDWSKYPEKKMVSYVSLS